MYISKKELLESTGISYGQLYRWKREGLIPEGWFIKRSSYTGQETFFLKDKILERIQTIQELKDQYSLEDLAKLLSPENERDVLISEEYLQEVKDIDFEILNYYKHCSKKLHLNFFDFILILAFQKMKAKLKISINEVKKMMDLNVLRFIEIGKIDFSILVFDIENELYLIVIKESAYSEMKKEGIELYFDTRMVLIGEVNLTKINDEFRKNNRKLFMGV